MSLQNGFIVQKLFVGLSRTTSVEANPLDVKSFPLPLVSSPKALVSAYVNYTPLLPKVPLYVFGIATPFFCVQNIDNVSASAKKVEFIVPLVSLNKDCPSKKYVSAKYPSNEP